jgi:hypothetical protein
LAGETCTVAADQDECNVGPGNTSDDVATSALAWSVECMSPQGCTTGHFIHAARLAIYAAEVTITDPTPPAITPETGALTTTTGYHRGTEPTTFSASDVTGIRAVRVYVDGEAKTNVPLTCDFTYVKPCPDLAAPRTLSVDTDLLADGEHMVEVAALDAAANETRGPQRRITVDHTPPPAPINLKLDGGDVWRQAATVSATYQPTPYQVAPVTTAHWRLCPAGTTSNCSSGSSSATGALAGITIPGEGRYELSVSLEDAAGNHDPTARATTLVQRDVTPPAAPNGFGVAPRPTEEPAVNIGWGLPDNAGAPIVAADWALCPVAPVGACLTGSALADRPLDLRLPSVGTWRLELRLRDAAGNVGPAVTETLVRTVATPAPPTPAPPTPTATAQPGPRPSATPVPRSRVAAAVEPAKPRRTATAITVAGRLHKTATGKVRITFRATGAKRTVTTTARIRRGRFTATLKLPKALRTRPGRMTIRYPGDATHRPQTTTVGVRRPAARK